MKLIVDIPEETYTAIKNNLDTFPRKYKEWGLQAIADGIPHPCPCDLCRYNPPSSADGKPCSMCVAEGRE